mmetsp:Transcript_114621/g.331194  ORF Transcript_114621/g.331194 Transcript_114621/m.331194 type:complete len:551 (+) Transcript_114621:2370-4022(+)
MRSAARRHVEDEEQRSRTIPGEQQADGGVVVRVAFGSALAVRLVRQDDLHVVLRDPLPRPLRVVALHGRQGREGLAILQGANDRAAHRLRPEHGPDTHLLLDLHAQVARHELLVQPVAARILHHPRAEQALGKVDPLIGELGDDEGQIGVHTVTDRWQCRIPDPDLPIGILIHRILAQGAVPQEGRRRNDRLVVCRDDHRKRWHRAEVEVLPCERVRVRVESEAASGPARRLDPLEGVEEEGEPLAGDAVELLQVDRLLPLRVLGDHTTQRVEGATRSRGQTLGLLGADVGLLEEIVQHRAPDALPIGAEGLLEETGLAANPRPEIDRDARILQVVQETVLPHGAADDGRVDVEDEVYVDHAREQSEALREDDARHATHATERRRVRRADAILLREAVDVTEACHATKAVHVQTADGGEDKEDLHEDATAEHQDPHARDEDVVLDPSLHEPRVRARSKDEDREAAAIRDEEEQDAHGPIAQGGPQGLANFRCGRPLVLADAHIRLSAEHRLRSEVGVVVDQEESHRREDDVHDVLQGAHKCGQAGRAIAD